MDEKDENENPMDKWWNFRCVEQRESFFRKFRPAEAGFFASFFSLPFDFVKTQMQKQKKDPVTGGR